MELTNQTSTVGGGDRRGLLGEGGIFVAVATEDYRFSMTFAANCAAADFFSLQVMVHT